MTNHQPHSTRSKKQGNKLLIIGIIVCLVIALICGGMYAAKQIQFGQASNEAANTEVPAMIAKEDLPENPIDFTALQEENGDIYAWLTVPNTKINYPILQHPTDDFFYLKNDKNGQRSAVGAIYTELANSKNFDDPVTVVYGHNIKNGLMFNTLHAFEDKTFFEENSEFMIYTPGHALTYKIVAAQGYDDSHILNTHDFSDVEVLKAYFNELLNPTTRESNVREGAELNEYSKIVQLSTCNYTAGNQRYLVTGVLLDDQPTQ